MADPSRFRIPAGPHQAEQVIRRSRFICSLGHAEQPETALAFIRTIRERWPDSRHHATAWVAGPPGSTARVGMSDDGEPHGSAGRPMLNVLLHSGVGEIVAVVTRWFGGIKLGTGGLARAYAGSVEQALTDLPTIERMDTTVLDLSFDYSRVDGIRHLLPRFEAGVLEEQYLDRVRFRLRLPQILCNAFQAALADATQGEALVRIVEE